MAEDVEEIDEIDDDDMDNAEPPASAAGDSSADNLTEDKIEAGIKCNSGAEIQQRRILQPPAAFKGKAPTSCNITAEGIFHGIGKYDVRLGGEPVALSSREIELLEVLASDAGSVFNKLQYYSGGHFPRNRHVSSKIGQLVAYAPDRYQVAGLGGVLLDFLADLAHHDGDGAGIGGLDVAPERLHGHWRKDYRVADAAKKNPEQDIEEVVVTEDVEGLDDLDDDDMDTTEPPTSAASDSASDGLTEDKRPRRRPRAPPGSGRG